LGIIGNRKPTSFKTVHWRAEEERSLLDGYVKVASEEEHNIKTKIFIV
jgi:hypothetical protein